MVDNTRTQLGLDGDVISTDEITTLNGVAIVTGEKAQRFKVGFGSDGLLRDVDATNPLPVVKCQLTTACGRSYGCKPADQCADRCPA